MAAGELGDKAREVRDATRGLARLWPLSWQATLNDQPGHARLSVPTGELPVNQLDFLAGPDDDQAFAMARYRYAASGILASVLRTNFTTDELFDNIAGIEERMTLQQQDPYAPTLRDYEELAQILGQAPTKGPQG
jgi:hypothetical protein